MSWLEVIVNKYPGWSLVALVIVLISFAEALGEIGKNIGRRKR